jgi:two-component system, sensor histidine kinase RpfC
MSNRIGDTPLSLVQIAASLHDNVLDAALSGYREPEIARLRVYGLSFAAAWAFLWYFLGPTSVPKTPRWWNYPQAVVILPHVLVMLAVALAWLFAIQRQWIQQSQRVDALGAIANMLGVAVLLYGAFDLMIAFICYLPIISITVGARFNRRLFYGTILASVIIVLTAPSDLRYFAMRPHFALFAATLLVMMPLSVVRLLNIVRAVSEVAVKSRDAQSQFIATMSHELRTPLNSVINSAVLIDVEKMPDSQRQIVDALLNSATALRHRVNEVLDVRMIEAGSLTILSEPFRISSLLKTIRDVAEPLALAKNIEIEVTSDDVADIVLQSDATRLEQVITNLVTNAVKFTPEGGTVELRAERDGPQTDAHIPVRFSIADTGPGIPEDDIEKIWLPFHQLSSGSARRHGGVGLGLFLVKSILSYLDGAVEYAPRPGGGSVFHVRLTFSRAAPGALATPSLTFREAVEEHRKHTPPMRCLVIDDATSNLETIDRLLSIAGHTIVRALSGHEGLRMAHEGRFDLILLDLHMPDLTGNDVLGVLCDGGVMETTPIYMLSADASPEAIRQAEALGAHGYLTKPINYMKLLALLEKVGGSVGRDLSMGMADQGLSGVTLVREAAGTESARLFAVRLFVEIDNERKLLVESIAREDLSTAMDQAHRMKNKLLNAGDMEGADICENLRHHLKVGELSVAASLADQLGSLVESTRARVLDGLA